MNGIVAAKPDLIDNREGNTLATALRMYLEHELATRRDPPDVWIATSYFKPNGFPLVADVLEKTRQVRLLLGAEPEPGPPRPRRLGETLEEYEASLIDQALRRLQDGLEQERDLLGFAPETDEMLRRLIAFLRSDNVEVKLYRPRFLHGKAFVFPGGNGVIVGSSNFTRGGLRDNLELNLGRYDPEPVGKVEDWYEELWQGADPFDLAALYEARFEPYSPYLIYLRVLWELYGREQVEDGEAVIPLTDFQRDGLMRAKRIMDEYNGVLIADGVGLGKTYIGGELLRETIYKNRQRALLIAPAALRDGTWNTFCNHYSIKCDMISYEQLANERLLGAEDGGSYLRFQPEEYALVVIDEAQGFRNPATRRADALRRLLSGDPPKKVVMLSATPVNNTLWDLHYQLAYFLAHDAVLGDRGIFSLQKRFAEASAIHPYELKPEVLFDVLDATCVRRTRHFVRKWYPNARFHNARGELVPVSFPKPQVKRVDYHFNEVLPGFFDELEEALMPEVGPPKLTMARYAPSRYLLERFKESGEAESIEELEEPHERMLVGLLRSALLKRFESSVHAFGRTAERMANAYESFLQALEGGYVARAEVLADLEDVDSDEALEELDRLAQVGRKVDVASQYDVERLRDDAINDRDLLLDYARVAHSVKPDDDPKLQVLVESLVDIAEQAQRDGFDEDDRRDKRKVLVFSYYADTVEWIEEFLRNAFEVDERLECYKERIASVTSDDSRGGVSREKAIFGFAPVSTEAPPGHNDDKFDILICTDILAEGMNLQQSRHVINYDLPWNPMRIVQRNGRIDRIGSPYDRVYVRCFFPDERLNELLELEERVRMKLAQAAASVGVETPPVPGAPTGERVFADTREEIERLQREEATLLETAGEDPSAYSGEEYRQELSRGIERHGREVRSLPWAAGSGHVAEGKRKGWAFCVKVGDRALLRFVPVESDEIERDTLQCLKHFTCEESTERQLSEELQRGVYDAWQKARADIHQEWTWATDPANLQPEVPRICRAMASHLRQYPPHGMDTRQIDSLLERLEAPWPRRVQNALRDVFESDEEPSDPYGISQKIVARIKQQGLQPFRQPEPLPPIDEDQIMLVCWMAVDAE